MQRELFNKARVPGQSGFANPHSAGTSSSSPLSGSSGYQAHEEYDLGDEDDLLGDGDGGHHQHHHH